MTPNATQPSNQLQYCPRTIIQFTVLCFFVVLSAGAFTVSFFTQKDLAILCGIDPSLAWLIPVLVDIAILALTFWAVLLKLDDRGTWLAYSSIGMVFLVSMFFNIYLTDPDFVEPVTASKFYPNHVPVIWVATAIHLVAPVCMFFMLKGAVSVLVAIISEPSRQIVSQNGSTNGHLSNPSLDIANQRKQENIVRRRAQVAELKEDGRTIAEMANGLGVNSRTIKRDLEVIEKQVTSLTQ